MNAVVLTSENSAEFYAKRLDLKPPEPAVAPANADGSVVEQPVPGEPAKESEGKTSAAKAETETDGEQDSQHPDPEKRQKLNQRFSDLTKVRDDALARAEKAEKEAKEAREAHAKAENDARNLRSKYEPPKSDDLGPRPQRAQFVNEEEHAQALEEWATDKANRERDQKEEHAKTVQRWNENAAPLRAALPDYDAVLAKGAELVVSDEVRDAILDSEVGPGIVYHLADNPDLVEKLKGMKLHAALRLIGKLEATEPWKAKAVKAAPGAQPKPAAVASEISRAPAPISPLRAAATEVTNVPVDEKGEFHGTAAEWRRLRKEGKIK